MQNFSTTVCVIGAGPGGCAAALKLSDANINCLLVDKAVFPRDKICGDALSGKVVLTLKRLNEDFVKELGQSANILSSWGVTFIAPNGKALKIPFKKEFSKGEESPGYISKRIDFDQFLFSLTKKQKFVTTLEGTELNDFKKTDEGWIITDKKQTVSISCKIILAADGAHSQFAKTFGNIQVEHTHYCAGIRCYYKGIKNLDPDGFIELHFLKDFLPGYFWIFPLKDGYANVGVGMRSDFVSKKKINLKKQMLRVIEKDPALRKRFEGAEMVDEIRGYGLPLGSKKRIISGDGFMLIGDAASLIDPFTGEGIGNAMISGVKAVEQSIRCLHENNFSAGFMNAYDVAVYKRLWAELSLSKRMQNLVKYPWIFNLVVNKASKSRLLQETIMSMFEDLNIRNKLRSPGFYFKLLFMGK